MNNLDNNKINSNINMEEDSNDAEQDNEVLEKENSPKLNDKYESESNLKETKNVYDLVMDFKRAHKGGIAWRVKKHCRIIEKHLNPGEKVIYAFCGQKNMEFYNIFTSCIVALTNKRLLIGQKRVFWGYFFSSITPDLYNDLQVYQGLLFGKLTIDTVKEVINISNLPKSALNEIETNITEFMMKEKQKYKMMGEGRN